MKTALFEAVGGTGAGVARAPAWLGSVATLTLLAALLLGTGMRPAAAGSAIALVAATPMFLYGSMLDADYLAALRHRRCAGMGTGRRGGRVPLPLAAALTGIAVLSGWQSLLVAVIVGGWAIARLVRRSGRRSLDAAFATGALVGLAFLAAWLLWASGWTLAPLLDQFRARTGWTAPVPVGELVAATVRASRAHELDSTRLVRASITTPCDACLDRCSSQASSPSSSG